MGRNQHSKDRLFLTATEVDDGVGLGLGRQGCGGSVMGMFKRYKKRSKEQGCFGSDAGKEVDVFSC